jgi:hypothetical protein
LPSIRTTSGHAIKLYRLPVSSRISQYPWPAQSCPVAPPRCRSLPAAARTCRRQGSGDHLVTAPPPIRLPWRARSNAHPRDLAGTWKRRRRRQLAAGRPQYCHLVATVALTWPMAHLSVSMCRIAGYIQ